MTATHSLLRSSAPPMAPTLASRTTTSRILTAPSTWISIARKTTLRPIPYSKVRSSSTIGMGRAMPSSARDQRRASLSKYASEMNGKPSRVVPISRSTARGSSSSNMRTCREERKSGRRSPRPPKSIPATGFTGGRVARHLSILMSSSTNTVYSQEIILPLHCSYIY